MVRRYQLKEPEHVRQAMAALIAMKLEVEETNLALYRPLPAELQPVFRRALERVEAGTPLAQITELTEVRAHLDSEEHTRRDFGQFKRDCRAMSLQLAEAAASPTMEQAQAFSALIAKHPAASPASRLPGSSRLITPAIPRSRRAGTSPLVTSPSSRTPAGHARFGSPAFPNPFASATSTRARAMVCPPAFQSRFRSITLHACFSKAALSASRASSSLALDATVEKPWLQPAVAGRRT